MSTELTESEQFHDDNVDDIVHDIQKVACDVSLSSAERCRRVSVLLEEMEEYTQPLIEQIQALPVESQQLILCRIGRIFPEIIQKEIKSVTKIKDAQLANTKTAHALHQNEMKSNRVPATEVSALTHKSDVEDEAKQNEEGLHVVLARLGYSDVKELYRHSKQTQIFGEFINSTLQRKASEKATSKKVDKQLYAWKEQRKEVEQENLSKLKEQRKSIQKFNKQAIINPHEPALKSKNNAKKVMMMIGEFDNEADVEAICNASSKALRKLI